MNKLKRVVIKQELVELTGDYRPALILNQFIYWTERMKDTDKYIPPPKKPIKYVLRDRRGEFFPTLLYCDERGVERIWMKKLEKKEH